MSDKEKPVHRRSIRLRAHDYSAPAIFFITICTHVDGPSFGNITHDQMTLNECGQLVESCWKEIPSHFPHVELDEFIIMPNHVHGILVARPVAKDRRGVACYAPTNCNRRFRSPGTDSLGAIIRSFKSAAARRINQLRGSPDAAVWQRNYYEHVIRNDYDFQDCRNYIINNPRKWAVDHENPDAEKVHPR